MEIDDYATVGHIGVVDTVRKILLWGTWARTERIWAERE